MRSPLQQRRSPIGLGDSSSLIVDLPGFSAVIRRPLSIVSIFVRPDLWSRLSDTIERLHLVPLPPAGRSTESRDVAFCWAGAGQFYAVGEDDIYEPLRREIGALASLVDQSDGRVMLRLQGPAVRRVLAAGCPVDLHPRVFGAGYCAVTQIAHVGGHLRRVEDDAFELSVGRSYAAYFCEWLNRAEAITTA